MMNGLKKSDKIEFHPAEKWKEITFPLPLPKRYAITNFGRLISFTDSIEEGRILKGGLVEGYRAFHLRAVKDGKAYLFSKYIHRLVAEYFLPTKSPDANFVTHLDFNKLNNHFTNLKWVTHAELVKHNLKNPGSMESIRRLLERNMHKPANQKLTTTQVIRIKKMLFNPKRKTRMKIIAKQFGISEMQLYRIKSGENWGHVKI